MSALQMKPNDVTLLLLAGAALWLYGKQRQAKIAATQAQNTNQNYQLWANLGFPDLIKGLLKTNTQQPVGSSGIISAPGASDANNAWSTRTSVPLASLPSDAAGNFFSGQINVTDNPFAVAAL